jgi:hypothetical protein
VNLPNLPKSEKFSTNLLSLAFFISLHTLSNQLHPRERLPSTLWNR